jgi:hypothetical protein
VTVLLRGETSAAVIHSVFSGALSEWSLALLGTEGTLVMDLFRDVLVHLPNDGGHLGRDVLRTTGRATTGHLTGVLGSGLRRISGRLDYGNGRVVEHFHRAIVSGASLGVLDAVHGRSVVADLEQITVSDDAAGRT